jgi:DNA polymerase-3 subunit epsilon
LSILLTTNDKVSDEKFEHLANILESSRDYRILRRLRSPTLASTSRGPTKRAIFVDVETTGLEAAKDTVIELAMLSFEYDSVGEIVSVGESFVGLRDPGVSIPAEVSALTGITDEMLAGKSIDAKQVDAIVADAALVIAHNAQFDRPFCEKVWPVFATKPWACSWKEVDWRTEGFEGGKLRDIAAGYGFFFDGHRADEDCRAGVAILARKLPKTGRTGLAALLDSARQARWCLWAIGAPFSSRETLKKRGYRWNTGDDGRPRAWHRDVSEQDLDSEQRFLLDEIGAKGDGILRIKTTAFDRYSHKV